MIGIYSIKHIESGKQYIGSSIDIKRRWIGHRVDLRRGGHHSRSLQRSWNKYGESGFCFEVLELCEEEKLIQLEQKYFDSLRPFSAEHLGFNENKIADKPPVQYGHNRQPWQTGKKRPPRTEEHKRKLSEALRGSKKSPRSPEHMANIWAKRRENGTDNHTKESKVKCGIKNIGRTFKHSEETRRKLSESKGCVFAARGF